MFETQNHTIPSINLTLSKVATLTASRIITPNVVLCISVNTFPIHYINLFKIKKS